MLSSQGRQQIGLPCIYGKATSLGDSVRKGAAVDHSSTYSGVSILESWRYDVGLGF